MKKQLRIHKIISSLLITSAVAGAGVAAVADEEDEDLVGAPNTEAVSEATPAAATEADEAEPADEAAPAEEASDDGAAPADEAASDDVATTPDEAEPAPDAEPADDAAPTDEAVADDDAAPAADEAEPEPVASDDDVAPAAADSDEADDEAAADDGEDAAEPAAEEATPAKNVDGFKEIAAKRRAVYKDVQVALRHVQELIYEGQIDKAEKYLNDIEVGLPKTPTSQKYFDACAAARRDIETFKSEALTNSVETLTASERANIRENVLAARRLLDRGRSQRSSHDLPAALKTLQSAKKVLPELYSANSLRQEIDEEIALVYSGYFYNMVEERSAVEAASYLKMVGDLLGEKHKIYRQLEAFYNEWRKTPAAQNPKTLNPSFARAEENGVEALRRAKAQYLYGDYHGALNSYGEALLYLPDNQEAKEGQIRIRKILTGSGELNRELMREVMFSDVNEKWRPAQPFTSVVSPADSSEKEDPLIAKMSRIRIPVSLRDAPLNRALMTLQELSETYDPVGRGVEIVLIDPDTKQQPLINLQMKDQPLTRVLETMLQTVNYRYDVKDGIVQVTPSSGASGLDYEEFTLSPKVVNRMAGRKLSNSGSTFASGGSEATEDVQEEQGIKDFLTRAGGVAWEGDRSLAYDASSNLLMVMQDRKALDRIRKVLQSLATAETKQVNIEAKFIEVNSTALNQLTANWALTSGDDENNLYTRATTNNRTVADAHATVSSSSETTIYTPPSDITDDDGIVTGQTTGSSYVVAQPAPQITRQPNYGYDSMPTFTGVIGTIGDYDLRLVLNALSGVDGTDLMAAPSLTVQSEMEATIKIVQLLRWPQSYDDMEIQVSSSSSNSYNSTYGASSVGITPGTPQFDDDATEVGIQMVVTPRVNTTDNSITMELHPEIREFEGFVEYGGTAVAISSGTVVTTPAGFFQPVFNLREVQTTVEVYDGGTIVIGGLTREEVRSVNDKVPVLGDLPLIGAAFRSTGKSITKKNLLIFVTANLMARGGGTEQGLFKGTQTGATYSNPSLFISSGPVYREYDTSTISDNANTTETTTDGK